MCMFSAGRRGREAKGGKEKAREGKGGYIQ